jgi:hypothetical protein
MHQGKRKVKAPKVRPRATVKRSGQHRRSDRGQEGQQQTNNLIDFLLGKKQYKAFNFASWQTSTPKKYAVKLWRLSKARTQSLKCSLENFFMPTASVINSTIKVSPANRIFQ